MDARFVLAMFIAAPVVFPGGPETRDVHLVARRAVGKVNMTRSAGAT